MTILCFLFAVFALSIDIGEYFGYGYSSDSQSMSGPCFRSYVAETSDSETTFELEEAFSYKDLQTKIHTSVGGGAGIGIFDVSGKFSYLRDVEDTDYSISMSYYVMAKQSVYVGLEGSGLDALVETSVGKYNDTESRKFFGVTCGDHYVSEYQQGAMLVISVDIHFKSHVDKKQWIAEAGIGLFWNIIKLSGKIQIAAAKLKMDGKINIKAFQYGGNVTRLPRILKKNEKGIYYALKCSLLDMDDCVKASDGILDYAIYDFPNQYSFENQKGLANLGVGYLKVNPIDYIGLETPKSLVTQEVKDTRTYLENLLFENKYYVEKLNNLLSGYPVNSNKTGSVFETLSNLLETAQGNVDILLQHNVPDQGPSICYLHPSKCLEETQRIKSQLKIITKEDLESLEDLKYYFPIFVGDFYPTGGKYPDYSWDCPLDDLTFPMVTKVRFALFNKTYGEWDIDYILKDGGSAISGKWTGHSNDGIYYVGTLITQTETMNMNIEKKQNPFYFENFNEKENENEENLNIPQIYKEKPKSIESKIEKTQNEDYFGWGYSADTQQTSRDVCFNTVHSKNSKGQSSFVRLNEAISFADIQSAFQVSIKKKIGFWIFSVTVISTYLRKIEDTDYTLSLNYYSYTSEDVSLEVLGSREGILTESGLKKYKDPDSFKNFGLTCGDYVVTNYEIGAILAMSIHLDFQSHYDKHLFGEALKLGFFGNAFEATLKIQLIMSKLKTKGKLTVHALQIGGNVTEINHILPDSQGEGHYSITCDLGTLDSCQKAASEILDYAVIKFPEQFSFENRKGVVELGLSKFKAEPIGSYGLKPPNSLVDQEVENSRNELSMILWENKYYMDKFYQLAYYYPVEINDTEIQQTALELEKRAKNNYNRLFHQNTTSKGAAQCFYSPADCVKVKKEITDEIKPILPKELDFIKPLKYFMPIFAGSFWPTGGSPSETSWDFLPGTDLVVGRISKIYSIFINSTYGFWDIDFIITDPKQKDITYRGSWEGESKDGIFYNGIFDFQSKKEKMEIIMETSYLFFEPYEA